MAVTQDELYATLDLELSWSETALPERERTKHVHRLHPYHGKFIPQLVEVLLDRYVPAGGHVLDPFGGSGTTLVQSLESGYDATGVDIAAFNCLLMRVKTAQYDLGELGERAARCVRAHRRASSRAARACRGGAISATGTRRRRGGRALRVPRPDPGVPARRRAPRRSSRAPHGRRAAPRTSTSRRRASRRAASTGATSTAARAGPSESAVGFLCRYTRDTLARIEEFAEVRDIEREATVIHGDSREAALGGPFDAVLTSPPYPGLIDYHEQHRYAYELLGLDDRREREIGAAESGTSLASIEAYRAGIAAVLERAASALRPGAPILVVVNDRRDLYPEILSRAGLRLEERRRRHVNRRTGRRAGEYYEDVLVAYA